jgi:hypothetical protein
MAESAANTSVSGQTSALRSGLSRIPELLRQLWLGVDGKALAQLMDGLRFADGQGQLWPLRVLALDARLRRPLRAAGCTVVVDDTPIDEAALAASLAPAGPPAGAERPDMPDLADLADALCALATGNELLPRLIYYARRVRRGGLLVLCSRPGSPARPHLAAALLHAGLTDVVQLPAGRMVLTAGRVTYPPERLTPGPAAPDPGDSAG